MQNTGDTTWSAGGGYWLGSQNLQDIITWGTNRIAMGGADSVAPGESYTFRGTLTAAATPGDTAFQWQLLQEAVEWFGAPSDNLLIQVTGRRTFSCDGSETLCLDLRDYAALVASGATVGGNVSADGFLAADQGGLDWHFGPESIPARPAMVTARPLVSTRMSARLIR